MSFIVSQFTTLPYPTESFDGKTVIVTGSNVGLGLEAARHFARLGASKVILACRSIQKGEEAQKSIEKTTHRLGVCEVWQLDMEDFDSVKVFAKRAEKLERLDLVMENAGIALLGDNISWSKKADMESTIAVNVVGTFLLALLMLPILRKSGEKHGTLPHLCIVSSDVHSWCKFGERNHPRIFDELKKDDKTYLSERYPVSKLLEILTVICLAQEMTTGSHASQKVILNTINPGLCQSSLTRNASWTMWLYMALLKFVLARTTEAGSRTLVAGALAGEESHGKYMSNCMIAEPSDFVRSEDGRETGQRVYRELLDILEGIQPGISKNI